MAGSGGFDKILTFLLLNSLLYVTINADQHRLNVPRVLLPVFHDFPVNFTLEVTEGGCYHWSTSRPDIIRLIPTNEHYDYSCSLSVIVQTVTRETIRSTAIVLAEESNTGHFLRCDVIVDAISSLYMVTTTRELFIEEAPEAFEVRAYDEQGNEFTTLAGIEFAWAMSNTHKRGVQSEIDLSDSVLRFMTFEESPYETPNTVAMLDKIGKMGNIVLMEGVKTGTAKVSVKLMHKEYRNVLPVEVELIVIDNLIIIPANVTVMQYDSFKYKIMQVHQGRLEEIKIPSSQYYLQAEWEDVLKIDNDKGTAYALTQGRTKVQLYDKNVNEDYGVILPTAEVSVSDVSYIKIAVLPHKSRYLIMGRHHEITIELFNSKDQKFYIGDNVEASLKINNDYFDTILYTKNGTHMLVVPTKTGLTQVEAILYGVIDNFGRKISLSQKLIASTELTIHSEVNIHPRTMAMPWDSNRKLRSDIVFKASGGDGSYVWNSRQPSIVTVSQNGIVKFLQEGSTDIVVAMARNPNNRDVGKVFVLPPTKLEITEYIMEVAIGERLNLHIALYGQYSEGSNHKEIPFNDCKSVPFEVYISDHNFFLQSNNSDDHNQHQQPVGIACATLSIVAQNVGTSVVTVVLNVNGRTLTDNVTVAAYDPLTVLHPDRRITLLAVGTSRKLIFRGGPRPWCGKPRGYVRSISSKNPEIARVSEYRIPEETKIGQSEIAVFEVFCEALGESTVTFTVSNVPLLPNCKRIDASVLVTVICAKPRYLYLLPEFKDVENCPLNKETDKIIARAGENVRLNILVQDENGRHFDNVSSFNFEWHVQPNLSGRVHMPIELQEDTFVEYDVILPKLHYVTILPHKNMESMTLKSKIVGYQKILMNKMKIIPEWPPFPIRDEQGIWVTPNIETTLQVLLVNDTKITPRDFRILNDQNNKYELKVTQGSGYFDFILSSNEIADIRYVEPTRWISVIPKKAGTLHLSLEDLCLSGTRHAEVTIEVQQLGSLDVDSITKVQVGSCITAIVTLYDTNAYLIELPSLNIVNVSFEVENGFVKIERDNKMQSSRSELRYTICGLEEGEAQVIFRSGHAEEIVESEAIGIQVFSPLKIIPNSLTILRGTIYQVSIKGGPKNTDIEFSSGEKQIVTVESDGLLEGKATGRSYVIARAVGSDSRGNQVVYSEDRAEIHVTVLEGVRIVSPTNRVKEGATIPLWVFGIPDHLTPLVIGAMRLPLIFSWSSSDSEIISLGNMYEGTGINVKSRNEVTLRAKALKPGIVTVSVNVSVPCHYTMICNLDKIYSSSLKIEVFEELKLLKKNGLYNGVPMLMMAPHSMMRLNTNRDSHGGVTTYKIASKAFDNLELEEGPYGAAMKIISLDKNGVVKSGDVLGKTIIFVTNIETNGLKQTIPIVIDVKPVHYLMLTLQSTFRLKSGEELNMLPKGMEFSYVVEFFDNVGSKFDATNMTIKTMFSRRNSISLTKADDNAFSITFLDDSDLILKLYNEKYVNSMFDYAHMMIGDVLFPTKTSVTVGDIICFSMPLLSADGDPGYWKSSSPEILSIDAVTGIGKARNPGYSRVNQRLTTHLKNELEVQVQPIETVNLIQLRGKNITGMEVFSVPVILKGKDELIKENNVLSRGLGGCRTQTSFTLNSFPFTCNIQLAVPISNIAITDLFFTRPRFDIKSGFYFCDIIPIGPPRMETSTAETTVQISAVSRDIVSNYIEVTYFPPVYVEAKEVVFIASLSNTISSAVINIYGVPAVLEHLSIDVPEQISVGEQSKSQNFVQYKLNLLRGHEEIQRQKISITNDLTKQNISLFIRIGKYEQCCGFWQYIPWIEYILFYRYFIITAFVILLSLFYYWRTRIACIDLVVKNNSVFADKYPTPLRKSTTCTPVNALNTSSVNTSGGLSPSNKPFSAFEPVYGDPRGYYTPNARRNKSFNFASI